MKQKFIDTSKIIFWNRIASQIVGMAPSTQAAIGTLQKTCRGC